MTQPTRRRGRPRAFDGDKAPAPIQSLDRALALLETLAEGGGMTLSEIATALDQSPSTMYRVLSTLEAREVVEMDPQNQEWAIGPMAFRLGSAFLRRSGMVERSRPAMRALMEATGETSNLGIARHGKVMFISQVETTESIRAFFPPGTLSPMHASGIGKALLARFPADRLDRFLRDQPLDRFTDKTLITPNALRADLARGRDRGFAVDDEETTIGMRCVAAPILNVHDEAVAGISVSGPSHRLAPEDIARVGRLVADAAAQVSRRMGA